MLSPQLTPTNQLAEAGDFSIINRPTYKLYQVSITKLVMLFVATKGLFAIYWFYKNWSLLQPHFFERISPAFRGAFSFIYAHQLFDAIRQSISQKRYWPYTNLASIYVLGAISYLLSKLFYLSDYNSIVIEFISVLLLAPMLAVLVIFQRHINAHLNIEKERSNNQITPLNILTIYLGAMIWIFPHLKLDSYI